MGNTLISHHILSSKVAVYRTTGLHLRGSSRGTTVNTGMPHAEKDESNIKSNRTLCEMEGDTDVFENGLHECYAACPFGNPF